MYRALFISLLTSFALGLAAQEMTNTRLDSIFRASIDSVSGGEGRWELLLDETPMFCLTDERHDRMRIISPVQTVAAATPNEIMACMEANFHTALDVKYAIADEVIWVAFIHPLSPLREEQVIDALAQVRSAALTYGTIYTSTDLVFPKTERATEEKTVKPKTKRL